MTIDVVLARFNEDIGWTRELRPDARLFVYNKGDGPEPRLPNRGREAHTYLLHVFNNLTHLSDWTFFSQADPLPHCPSLADIINTWPFSYRRSALYVCPEQMSFVNHPAMFIESKPKGDDAANDCRSLWNELFSSDLDGHPVFAPGSIFAISKERLLSRTSAFYLKAMELAVSRKRGPWEFERLWAYLWTSSAATRL